MNKRITISDTPQRINLANYESKLRRMRTELLLMVQSLDEGLERIEQQKKADARLIDALVRMKD